jgi:pimeloyl-ACP methyl ester carboxylesterase
MFYETSGQGDQAIIFIHGWSGHRQVWTDQVEHFKKNYTVITPDLPGFGTSDNHRQEWTMEQYGKDIQLLTHQVGANDVILVGHSMGAIVALEAARALGKRAKGVILVDMLQQVPSAFDSAREIAACNDMALNYGRFSYHFNYFADSALTERYIGLLPAHTHFPDHWKSSWMSHQRWKDRESVSCIREIQAPIRAINADETGTDTVAWKRHVRDYDVIVMPKSMHFLFWQYPKEFNSNLERMIQSLR